MIPWLPRNDPNAPFPDLLEALEHPNGLLCAGGDLSTSRLLAGYRHGVFPWYSEGEPILWWSPNPRLVIEPEHVHVSRRLERTIRSGRFSISMNQAFETVMRRCAEPRPDQHGTWITEDMLSAYARMHRQGHGHSLEVWQDDELVAGIYGLAIGRAFFGESMFHRVRDASKVALVCLCRLLEHHEFGLLDWQVPSSHLLSMGAIELPREEFKRRIDVLCAKSGVHGDWLSVPPSVQLAPAFRDQQ
jgi:leucyl/phenylalanyl-tRNA--protein transferase